MMRVLYKTKVVTVFIFLFIAWMETVALLLVGMAKLVIWCAGVTW